MTDREEIRLYGTYRVEAFDSDGNQIHEETVEKTGSIGLKNVTEMALFEDLDSVEITPLSVETRRGDETLTKIERKDQ